MQMSYDYEYKELSITLWSTCLSSPLKYFMGFGHLWLYIFNKIKVYWNVWVFDNFYSSFCIDYIINNQILEYDKCTSLVGSRNKLDHSEKKYELPLWWCTIKNKDLIILVFASFPVIVYFQQNKSLLKCMSLWQLLFFILYWLHN
jgi:hypothetical protein